MFQSRVIGTGEHVIAGAQLFYVAQPLELYGVNEFLYVVGQIQLVNGIGRNQKVPMVGNCSVHKSVHVFVL